MITPLPREDHNKQPDTRVSDHPVNAASTAISSYATVRLFMAAHCGGNVPTWMGLNPRRFATTGTSTQTPVGKLVINPVLGTLPLNSNASPPKYALIMEAAYSWTAFERHGRSFVKPFFDFFFSTSWNGSNTRPKYTHISRGSSQSRPYNIF